MTTPPEKKILAQTNSSEFVGRSVEIERLLQHAQGIDGPNRIALLAAPLAGTSELLRQVYDRMFVAGAETIPFYYQFKETDRTAHNAARRFLYEFLLQTVAYRRQDRSIIDAAPDLAEIARLALPFDGHWIDQIVDSASIVPANSREYIRNSFSISRRAADKGARSMVMLDGLQKAAHLEGGSELIEDLFELFGRGKLRYVLAGHRRFMFGLASLPALNIEPLTFTEAGALIEKMAAKTGVAINDQTRDLIAVQLGGRPRHI